jgi:NADH:ubiquinone oxidoreductase subunit 5 (subunit L)/multisubunit Na+/H+ antiporter MnhA subunit
MVEGRQHSALSRLGYMFLALSEAASWFDAKVIDRTVNGVCSITRAVATLSKWCDKWIIDGLGVNAPATIARLISYPMRSSEWGLMQWYALVMVTALVGTACCLLEVMRWFWLTIAALAIGTIAYMLLTRRVPAKASSKYK